MKKVLVAVSSSLISFGTAAPAEARQVARPAVAAESRSAAGTRAAAYLRSQAFSRSGLIEQLKDDGFSTGLAVHGVDEQHTDWNQQAAWMAMEYLETEAFSRSALVEQLEYEGFTSAQTAYGVRAAGL
ncbi:hypothetical protein ACWT_4585 [Actinoplanes sp. SE50]|uniref:Ltp family lipoprotein n=1 Tax=unclassified Actinoplanes TaxID=2626549 RepID=UPI00023ED46F|nr:MULTISPECIES: Ltp family lipoprotein [unclassified Actinoplanes]AEV85607.1 hypothetical protein ACPL_4716 [Actinoplanes sp. SE50/110]ATO84000.1 hypothetical protein ACWT_4585 [Actinoplanes sp. SE50]SLM01410.1 hypothetical protein ACSP50_4646 [Actinoplanes sp. SE50/110]